MQTEFTEKDAETIVQIVRNQPLQNLAAAEQLQALIARFQAFAKSAISARDAKVAVRKNCVPEVE